MADTQIPVSQMVDEIRTRKDFMLSNFRILRKADPNDHYWRNFLNLEEFTREGEMFEPGMLINWVGSKYQPRRILEIGTRTGGSLINLLSPYPSYDGIEVVSFDLWREYFSVTWVSRLLTKLLGSPDGMSQRNISRKYTSLFSGLIRYLSTQKVRRNLGYFNIPSHFIQFVSGDSKQTVPAYFQQHQGKTFDYVLVDGAHDPETAMIDLENVVEHVASGGFLVFDDIGPEGYKLGEVWETFKAKHQGSFDFYERYHRKGVAWAIKKS